MNRIANIMDMHARDRVTWFFIPSSILAAAFAIVCSLPCSSVGSAPVGPILARCLPSSSSCW